LTDYKDLTEHNPYNLYQFDYFEDKKFQLDGFNISCNAGKLGKFGSCKIDIIEHSPTNPQQGGKRRTKRKDTKTSKRKSKKTSKRKSKKTSKRKSKKTSKRKSKKTSKRRGSKTSKRKGRE
jgi:hypothetical protein